MSSWLISIATKLPGDFTPVPGLQIAPLDADGDGNVDLAFTTAQGFGVCLGNGDGTFQKPLNFLAGNGPNFLGIAERETGRRSHWHHGPCRRCGDSGGIAESKQSVKLGRATLVVDDSERKKCPWTGMGYPSILESSPSDRSVIP